LRAFKFVKDPKAFELIADETRRKMIYLLRAKDLSVSQIAIELNKTPQAIYHQIRKLLDAGLVEVGKEERVDHFIETYYRATAEVFEFVHGEGGGEFQESKIKEGLKALEKLGLEVELDDGSITHIVDLSKRLESVGYRTKTELQDKIAELENVDFLTKQGIAKYVQLLTMSDKQFDEMLDLERQLRTLLKSKITKSTPKPLVLAEAPRARLKS
jgi:DNA-binding transcriptional ArsR family regulator